MIPVRVRSFLLVMWLLVWPFLFFHKYVLGKIIAGNDFYVLYYSYKAYWVDAVLSGHFPLWSPTEAAGMPFFSNPFAQAFYPLNFISLAIARLCGGYSPYDHQMFALFGISLFGLGTFLWLRFYGVRTENAVVSAMMASVSLKIGELMRFPNALHAAAWYPFVLAGLTLFAKKMNARACVLLFLSLICILTAGYPYYVFYLPLLVLPYLLLLKYRFTLSWTEIGKLLGKASLPAMAAGGLCIPYLLKLKQFISFTTDRSNPSFEYSTIGGFTPWHTLGSWLFPPLSMHEGWYYFGFGTTVIISWMSVLLCKRDIRKRLDLGFAREWSVIIVAVALISALTWVNHLGLFKWIWTYVPLYKHLRYWARLNIILVPLISLLLARALDQREILLDRKAVRLLLWLGLGIIALQASFWLAQWFDHYWNYYFVNARIPFRNIRYIREWFFPVTSLIGLACLLLYWRRPFSFRVALILTTVLQLYIVSVHQWAIPWANRERFQSWVFQSLENGFRQPRSFDQLWFTSPQRPGFGVGVVPNWGWASHAALIFKLIDENGKRLSKVSDVDWNAARQFYGTDSKARRLFLTRGTEARGITEYMGQVAQFEREVSPKIEILRFNGDRLEVRVTSLKKGWLTYVDNWDPDWKARVNGILRPIHLLLGSYKSVAIEPGENVVEFFYAPSIWATK